MNKFCCKHCGAIHEAVPFCYGFTLAGWHYGIKCPVCGESTDFFRNEPFPTDKPSPKPPTCKKCGSPILIHYRGQDLMAECGCTLVPIECLDKRRWAKKADAVPVPVLRLELKAETRFGEIIQEEIDKAQAKGCNVKVIELPKFSAFKGIPIRYY